MIPSTTRASHAYSNDGCTVTAWARLTLQSFPTNKTLNTGPLTPLLSLNTAMSQTQVGRNCTLGYICFSPTCTNPSVTQITFREIIWRANTFYITKGCMLSACIYTEGVMLGVFVITFIKTHFKFASEIRQCVSNAAQDFMPTSSFYISKLQSFLAEVLNFAYASCCLIKAKG